MILGAGSSQEFNLPIGSALANGIAEDVNFYFANSALLRGDHDLYAAAAHMFGNGVVPAGRLMSSGLPLSASIDDFLYIHGHSPVIVGLGKLAIAKRILHAERGSKIKDLFAEADQARDSAFSLLADTWIYKLFTHLQTGVRLADVGRIFDNLKIINFNYDRCVEAFFYVALQRAYGLTTEQAATVMNRLNITHPYGQVGQLPWQCLTGHIGFGEAPSVHELVTLSSQIKTFTEQSYDPDEIRVWQDAIQSAHQLVVLGFGFHAQNVDLIGTEVAYQPEVYATCYNASPPSVSVFIDRIKRSIALKQGVTARAMPIEVENMRCSDFISYYGLHLFG